MKKTIVCIVVVLISTISIFAQKADYSKEQGYLEFKDISSLAKGDKGTEIIVESGLLKMLAKMAGEKNEELAKQFADLKLVRLTSFEIDDSNLKAVESKIASIDKELTGRNWDRVAKMKWQNEYYNIYVITAGTEKFKGIVITSINEKNHLASFINVVGEINPELIGKLAKNFNIPQLGRIKPGMMK